MTPFFWFITLPHFEHLNMASCLSHKSQTVIFKFLGSAKTSQQFSHSPPLVAPSCLFSFSDSKSDFLLCSASHSLLHTFFWHALNRFSSSTQLLQQILNFPTKVAPGCSKAYNYCCRFSLGGGWALSFSYCWPL